MKFAIPFIVVALFATQADAGLFSRVRSSLRPRAAACSAWQAPAKPQVAGPKHRYECNGTTCKRVPVK